MAATEKSECRHLRLISEPDESGPKLQGSRWPIDLRRYPYRPGELPETLVLPLPSPVTEMAAERARADGVPLALWVRLAIEAERVKDRVINATQHPPAEVEERLRVAGGAGSAHVGGLSPLARYASAILDRRGTESLAMPSSHIEVFIPSEMALAWRSAAAARNEALEAWAEEALHRSPGAVSIAEAGAAAAGESLAAWCYAAFLA